jgi:uncharacterized membrane protein (DUF485 family)
VVCTLYFGFLVAGIAEPQLLAAPLFAKGTVNLAMAFAIVIIIACAGLTGYYVVRTSALQGLLIALITGAAFLSGAGNAEAAQGAAANGTAKFLFFAILFLSLGITYWAARRTRSTSDFYAAGGTITPLQNGLALAGDYLSASALLGLTAFIYATGFDGVIYALGFVVGWPIVVFLVAERLRNLGKYTFADVVAYRLSKRPARIFAACSTLIVVTVYLLAQMVGAGQLIRLLFGLDYNVAVLIVGAMMILYVTFGGMVATHMGTDHEGDSAVGECLYRERPDACAVRLRFRRSVEQGRVRPFARSCDSDAAGDGEGSCIGTFPRTGPDVRNCRVAACSHAFLHCERWSRRAPLRVLGDVVRLCLRSCRDRARLRCNRPDLG